MKTTICFHWYGQNLITKKCEEGLNYSFEEMVGYFKAAKDWLKPMSAVETHYHSEEGEDMAIITPASKIIIPASEFEEIAPNVRETKRDAKRFMASQKVRIINFT